MKLQFLNLQNKNKRGQKILLSLLSGYQDSNLGPPAPKAGALTGLRYTPNILFLTPPLTPFLFFSFLFSLSTPLLNLVGVPGFEPGTPCSQSRCANRTALHPVGCCMIQNVWSRFEIAGAKLRIISEPCNFLDAFFQFFAFKIFFWLSTVSLHLIYIIYNDLFYQISSNI